MRRYPRPPPGAPLRGAGANPPRCPASLRSIREGRGPRSVRPPRPRQPVHVGSLPEGTRLPWHREFARFRAGAGGQRLRRALHPYLEREPALGAELRHHRAAPPPADRVSGGLQHDLAHRTARLPATCCHPSRAASSHGQRRLASNQVSHQPRAVHLAQAIRRHWASRTPCIGFSTSPSARMTAECAIAPPPATSPCYAKSPSTWLPPIAAVKPACAVGARRPPGTTTTCSGSSPARLMREPWELPQAEITR